MLKSVQIVQIPVSDQDVARDFYVDRLGLQLVADLKMGPHGRWLQVRPDGDITTLALVPGSGTSPAGSLGAIAFEPDDLDQAVETLTQQGVDFPEGIEDMPWGRAARFSDPDGNALVLQTLADE